MRYHIDTIPVWDAVKLDSECLLCALRRQIERGEVERFLGGSVMEPDTRVRVNAKGFCQRHHVLLYAQQNRLGHALMTHTHMKETRAKADKILQAAAEDALQGGNSLFRRFGKGDQDSLTAAADALDQLTSTCILCDSIADNMQRYAYTLLHLYTHDSAFKEDRTQFQRDFDRLIFSAPFRRMQNKTQVFLTSAHKGNQSLTAIENDYIKT